MAKVKAKLQYPDPDLWLQEYEASAKFDECECRLDSLGPGDEPGAAFYQCPLHAAAKELLKTVKELRYAILSGTTPDMVAALRAIENAEGRNV